MKQLKVKELREVIQDLNDDIPIVIMGERQIAVGVEVACQLGLDGEREPVTVMVQLIPK